MKKLHQPLAILLALFSPIIATLLLGHPVGRAATVGHTVAPTTQTILVVWDSNATVANATIPLGILPQAAGTIISCSYATAGTSASFVGTLQISTTPVTGCSQTVNSATPTTSTATANNTFVAGNPLTLVVSGVTNSPSSAFFQITYQTTAN